MTRYDKRAVRIVSCLRCGKDFPSKPKKFVSDPTIYTTEDYCLRCRLNFKVNKKLESHTVSPKMDVRNEVETLRLVERFNPELIRRLRQKKT